MLKLISLHCINQIFDNECLVPISPKAKIAYLQCLSYHFEDLEPKHENLVSFSIKKSTVNEKSLPIFEDLQKAGLVILEKDSILFINHWKKHIDKTKLDKISAHEYLAMTGYKLAEEYRQDVLNNKTFYEIARMQCKINSDEKVTQLINEFFTIQKAHEKSYPNYPEASMHCLGWIRKQVPHVKLIENKTIIKNNATRSIEAGRKAGSL